MRRMSYYNRNSLQKLSYIIFNFNFGIILRMAEWIMISRHVYKLYDIVKRANACAQTHENVYTRHKASAASDMVNSARNLPINCFKWITSAGLSENFTRWY